MLGLNRSHQLHLPTLVATSTAITTTPTSTSVTTMPDRPDSSAPPEVVTSIVYIDDVVVVTTRAPVCTTVLEEADTSPPATAAAPVAPVAPQRRGSSVRHRPQPRRRAVPEPALRPERRRRSAARVAVMIMALMTTAAVESAATGAMADGGSRLAADKEAAQTGGRCTDPGLRSGDARPFSGLDLQQIGPLPAPARSPGVVGIERDRERIRLPLGTAIDLGGVGKGRAADVVATGADPAWCRFGLCQPRWRHPCCRRRTGGRRMEHSSRRSARLLSTPRSRTHRRCVDRDEHDGVS